LIRAKLDAQYDLVVRMWETDRNYFEYPVWKSIKQFVRDFNKFIFAHIYQQFWSKA
jgi:hypothetical protein